MSPILNRDLKYISIWHTFFEFFFIEALTQSVWLLSHVNNFELVLSLLPGGLLELEMEGPDPLHNLLLNLLPRLHLCLRHLYFVLTVPSHQPHLPLSGLEQVAWG